MSSKPKQKNFDKEKGVVKLREKFGLKKSKSYADYLREDAEKGNKECEKTIRAFNRKKGRISKFNPF